MYPGRITAEAGDSNFRLYWTPNSNSAIQHDVLNTKANLKRWERSVIGLEKMVQLLTLILYVTSYCRAQGKPNIEKHVLSQEAKMVRDSLFFCFIIIIFFPFLCF